MHPVSLTPESAAAPKLAELTAALRQLRRPWPAHWPGLPLVWTRAWHQLHPAMPRRGSRAHALWTLGLDVVQRVEVDGASRQALGREPQYHNRLHIADTLVCMTYLLRAARAAQVPGAGDARLDVLALAIMAGHDYLHPGGSNAHPAQFETQAVHDLQPLMAQAGVAQADQSVLAHCILATDPTRVRANHQAVQARAFDLRDPDCLSVLVQEADILASTLPQTQAGLTLALSQEWVPTQPVAAGNLLLPQNRLLFLEHAALFSSPAAAWLGLDRVKDRQMSQIKRQLRQTA